MSRSPLKDYNYLVADQEPLARNYPQYTSPRYNTSVPIYNKIRQS